MQNREIHSASKGGQSIRRRARPQVAEAPIVQSVDMLRSVLEPFIDSNTDEIGRVPLIEGPSHSGRASRVDGPDRLEFTSSLRHLAGAHVQSAGIEGGNRVAGEPATFRTCSDSTIHEPQEAATPGVTGAKGRHPGGDAGGSRNASSIPEMRLHLTSVGNQDHTVPPMQPGALTLRQSIR